ncbi:MAG: hypothetical protein Q8K77_02950, partial [Thermodesulfovibrionales bacterium]|nr:hypothetical protein [Thermodesulfovibrionales bacterium]
MSLSYNSPDRVGGQRGGVTFRVIFTLTLSLSHQGRGDFKEFLSLFYTNFSLLTVISNTATIEGIKDMKRFIVILMAVFLSFAYASAAEKIKVVASIYPLGVV